VPLRESYDPEADALYLQFYEGSILRQVEVTPEIIVDEDADHRIIGIEILYPHRNWSIAQSWLARHGLIRS
jgi:uncharacterized protein YuzE